MYHENDCEMLSIPLNRRVNLSQGPERLFLAKHTWRPPFKITTRSQTLVGHKRRKCGFKLQVAVARGRIPIFISVIRGVFVSTISIGMTVSADEFSAHV